MNNLTEHLAVYLANTLGVSADIKLWPERNSLPLYLRENYKLFTLRFQLDQFEPEYILLVDSNNHEQSASKIEKHISHIKKISNMKAVYVREAVTAYNRKRLIEYHIPFVIPGNQMYLPALGLDLREFMRRLKKKQDLFSPSTQVLLLHSILYHNTNAIKPSEIGTKLGYSTMTMIRSFDQLEFAKIAEHYRVGKERHLHFLFSGKELWDKALSFLSTPVQKHLFLQPSDTILTFPDAGQTALSHYTMLAEPRNPEKAVFSRKWRSIQAEADLQQGYQFRYPESFRVEIWKYAPEKLIGGQVVDPLSLYLSLKDEDDERIQDALDSIMKVIKW